MKQRNSEDLHSCGLLYSMLMSKAYADDDPSPCTNFHSCPVRHTCEDYSCLNGDVCSREHICNRFSCPFFICNVLDERSC